MRRSGFTMIELIFVIVILGILAAVAIPKLTATRDDAKISKGMTEVATAVNDVGSFYTAQGKFADSNISDMTNVTMTVESSDVNVSYYRVSADADCVMFTLAGDGNLTVSATDANITSAGGTPDTAKVCTEVRTGIANLVKTHQFGGSSVVR